MPVAVAAPPKDAPPKNAPPRSPGAVSAAEGPLGTQLGTQAGTQPGTIDEMVVAVVRKIAASLPKGSRSGSDLALVVELADGALGSPELLGVVSRQMATRLRREGLRSVKRVAPSSLAQVALRRQLRDTGYEVLVAMKLSVVKGYLHLRGEVFVLSGSYWRDLVDPAPTAVTHVHSSHRVDAEIQAFSPGQNASKVNFALHRFKQRFAPTLALAQGDLDGDGRLELVVLHRSAVTILSYRGKGVGFSKRATIDFEASPGADLAPIASRRVFGSLVVKDIDGDGKAEIFARSSAFATTRRLNWNSSRTANMKATYAFPLAFWSTSSSASSSSSSSSGARPLHAVAALGMDHFTSDQLHDGPGKATLPPGFPALFYSLKSIELASKNGPRHFVGVVDTAGRFHLYDHTFKSEQLSLAGSGVAFDLLDLDDNGEAELVTSAANENGDPDRLTISRINSARQLRVLWRSSPLPGNVTALTHGDFDGDGKEELVGAIETTLGQSELVVFN